DGDGPCVRRHDAAPPRTPGHARLVHSGSVRLLRWGPRNGPQTPNARRAPATPWRSSSPLRLIDSRAVDFGLGRGEARALRALGTPQGIQRALDAMPYHLA